MSDFKESLQEYSLWRSDLSNAIGEYQDWRKRFNFNTSESETQISDIIGRLKTDKITLAFAAEFSRGKTELINALFFAETGVRLLPSSPGRTTMCPTELFYDKDNGSYIKLLDINTRLKEGSLSDFKGIESEWKTIKLDCDSPDQMQEAFKELANKKEVSFEVANELGLITEDDISKGIDRSKLVEIPSWRHALISFPHPLLKQGLSILDTPGLNALGTEPELTINMLPSAQAIVFIISADTGVTKSDLDIWESHLNKPDRNQSLAVVMNKIDAITDELSSKEKYDAVILKQITESAEILKIDPNRIFPLSAKQALVAKIKNDKNLLKTSKLGGLESFLSNDILLGRKDIVKKAIAQDIGFLVKESYELTNSRLSHAENELEDFKKVDFENVEMTAKLMAETRDRQNAYSVNVENFKTSAQVFNTQTQLLVDSLSREKIDEIIERTRKDMRSSKTTFGMKKSMNELFDELRELLEDAVDLGEETTRLTTAISKKFQNDNDFKEITLPSFSVTTFKKDLTVILKEGEEFQSSTKTVMTEKGVLVNNLYSTLINKARETIREAHKAATIWRNSALSPLYHQIKDHKKQIKARIEMLKKINRSKGSVEDNIKLLTQELNMLMIQHEELTKIKKAMHF